MVMVGGEGMLGVVCCVFLTSVKKRQGQRQLSFFFIFLLERGRKREKDS